MIRNLSRFNLCLLTTLLAAALALPAGAQSSTSPAPKKPPRPANLEKLDDVPPPPNTLIDPKVKPEETIREDGENKIVEYRMKGKVYKMRVIKPDGTSYWLIDPKGDGKFIADEKGVAPTNSVPMWVVYEW
ncbi:MAG: DUF2782 domain-containing protein [Burkholderiales bacterium]|nr:DUF2782 domain-containing protein [Burkholderiales bacterium]